MSRAKEHAKKIYQRIQYFVRHGIDNDELNAARNVLSGILNRLGITEAELEEVSAKEKSIKVAEFIPNIERKRNPKWFEAMCNLMSVHHGCRIVSFSDKIGIAIYGEDTAPLIEELSFLIERSKKTYTVICAFISGKKPRHEDYMLGFAFGYDAKLGEEKMQGVAEADSNALAIISKVTASNTSRFENEKIAKIERHVEKVVANAEDGEVKPTGEDIKIEDQNAFILGFHDGKNAKVNLLKKSN